MGPAIDAGGIRADKNLAQNMGNAVIVVRRIDRKGDAVGKCVIVKKLAVQFFDFCGRYKIEVKPVCCNLRLF